MSCGCLKKQDIKKRNLVAKQRFAIKGTFNYNTVQDNSSNSQTVEYKKRKVVEYSERLQICRDCPEVKYFLGRIRCSICGCFLGIKAALPFLHCPIEMW